MNGIRRGLNLAAVVAVLVAFGLIVAKNIPASAGDRLLNVSYDPTRELYRDLNDLFVADYQKHTGRHLTVVQSHGGSSRQARAVISGEEPADVVTLGLYSDVDALRKRGLIASGWADRLPNHSQPYTSTIVFVVRQGNPKDIKDWPDLLRAGLEIITPNPKTSGNGKLSALAAWGAIVSRGGSEADARAYLENFYEHVPVLDEGARGAATTFAVLEIGDVHLTWENEALREVAEAKGKLQIVYPPVSILAEPCVAWVDANVARNGTEQAARAYLEFLFSDEAQEVMARLGYRPYKQEILQRTGRHLPPITLFPITAIARDWDDAQEKFFAENGIIDAVMRPRPS
jgi:sulfate/thiosulfate transport system substrate-binding protein